MKSLSFDEAVSTIRDTVNSVEKFFVWKRFARFTSNIDLALDLIPEIRGVELPLWCQLELALFEARIRPGRFNPAGLSKEQIGLAHEVSSFVSKYPYNSEMASAQSLMEQAIEEESLSDIIIDSLQKKNPFSVLRLGDGEGRFLADLSWLPYIYLETHAIASRIWFWNSVFPDNFFWEDLRAAYRRSDVIGVNPPYRVDLEYRQSSTGYVGVVCGNNFAAQEATGKICANWIMNGVSQGWFEKIIREAETVNFIGAHPNIGEALSNFGAKKNRLFLTPSDNIVPNVISKSHYPEVYNYVKNQIKSGYEGIWIVAAGAYAKIYCDVVRASGGVALDVGSLADRWMGLKTR